MKAKIKQNGGELSINEEYREISPADFFYRNRDLAGFSNPTRSLYSAIRELLENSLDACELYKIRIMVAESHLNTFPLLLVRYCLDPNTD
jgi:DNA topoisomerase VI subunit B